MPENVETVAQFAARRGISRRTVIDWIKLNYVHAVRKGHGPTSPWLIDRETRRQDSDDAREMLSRGRPLIPSGTAPTDANAQRLAPAIDRYIDRVQQRQRLPTVGEPLGKGFPGSSPDQHSDNEPRYVDDIDGMDPRDAARARLLDRAIHGDGW